MSYKDRKVINIGTVSEITGLSIRQIRYYEERQLIFPERTKGGTRKFSFSDIEKLMDIANQMEDGLQTLEIKRMENQVNHRQLRDQMIRGQINAAFGMRK